MILFEMFIFFFQLSKILLSDVIYMYIPKVKTYLFLHNCKFVRAFPRTKPLIDMAQDVWLI